MDTFEIRSITVDDRSLVRDILERHWNSVIVVSRGRLFHADQIPGFLAHDRTETVGMVTYSINETECEIVTMNSFSEGRGIGSALLDAVKPVALEKRCTHLRLITTNDNLTALRFYQKRGFTLRTLHRNSIEAARRLKPGIPILGINGIPIRDEIELEMRLS